MRFYSFIHQMLSPIQQGLQSQQVLKEMFNKYVDETNPVSHFKPGHKSLFNWSRNHKTAITLNGGNSQDLNEFMLFLMREVRAIEQETGFELPWVYFMESKSSLNELVTGVGIILPQQIYDTVNTRDLTPALQLVVNARPGWYYIPYSGKSYFYPENSATARLLEKLKTSKLAV